MKLNFLLSLALFFAAYPSYAAPVNRFDVVTLCCDCPIENHLCEPQFDALNWSGAGGHYLAMGTDEHRGQVTAAGNVLAVYYDVFNKGSDELTAAEKAAGIEAYARSRFTGSGPRPQWLILNEISAGKWPVDAAYRQWAADVVSILHNQYHFSVILCAPFQRPGAHSGDWRAVATNATIGIECYLSGKAIKEHEFSTNWCAEQYRISREKYLRLGVPADRLFLVEDFANTDDAPDRTWGRQGVSAADWQKAIEVRSAALHKIGFAGFISYGWSGDRMKVPDEELIDFEKIYRAQVLP